MTHNACDIATLIGENFHRPQFVFRPETLSRAVNFFLSRFDATQLFAVKTNPEPMVLQGLYAAGIRTYDVASLAEVALVHDLFDDVTLFFMNPVKSRHDIREAYFRYGVRHFSLDCEAELEKILQETDNAKDLSLHVRLAIPNNFAELALAEKFGVNLQSAPELIKQVAARAEKFGVCFHVGSQCMHPDAYRIAMRMASEVLRQTGVSPDYFNVGGGFPSIYPGMTPPNLQEYFDAIHEEFSRIDGHESMVLLAEPGRALVAECMSLIVRVEMRRAEYLYLNDGTYGSLFDAGTPGFIFPMKLITNATVSSTDLMPFSFYGPTCDSLDYMQGPFYLPRNIKEGDYIEIGQMGAYGKTMRTAFNGFTCEDTIAIVNDEPLMTLYGQTHSAHEKLEIIAA